MTGSSVGAVGEWRAVEPPAPEVLVPFGTVITRILIAGGMEGLQTLLQVLAEAEPAEGELPPVYRLMNAVQGIYPDDPQARALLTAAGFDPDEILAVGPAP